jgi:DNA-binding XRE family transcriptional regulator
MNPIYQKLGDLIKQKRMELSLSQNELAYRCLLHEHCIYKIEKAKSEIKLSTLMKIFKELGLKFELIDELIRGVD